MYSLFSAKCPFDEGSQWKDVKVCFCKNLATGSGVECSSGRQFSPKKVKVDGDGSTGSGKPASGTEGSFSAVNSDPEEKGGLAVGAGVGIGVGALAVLAVGCLGGWMLLGRGKRKEARERSTGSGMGSGSTGGGPMGSGGMMGNSSGGVSPSADGETAFIDFSSSGEAAPWMPPLTPGFMQKDYVNITPPPSGGDAMLAMTDSAGVGVQSTFLAADTPPPAEVWWDGRKERDILATTVTSAHSRGTGGTGATPPLDDSGARGGARDPLETTGDLGTSGGTGGTGGTAGSTLTE